VELNNNKAIKRQSDDNNEKPGENYIYRERERERAKRRNPIP
jgi:hypothetical protein